MKIIYPFLFLIVATLPSAVSAQLISVTGFVYNSLNGDAIDEASIFESSSGIGTITDKNGYYKLILRPGNQKIRISGTGYEPYAFSISLQKDTVINIHMKQNNITENKFFATFRSVKESDKEKR
jgi:hypothetical protein